MKKVDNIKAFIQANKPSRKELTKFIVCQLNKVASASEFDKNPQEFRGYYATNITKMRRLGNIEVKNGKYQLTKQALKHNTSLYVKPLEVKVQEQEKRIRELVNMVRTERTRNAMMKELLSDIGHLIDISLD